MPYNIDHKLAAEHKGLSNACALI